MYGVFSYPLRMVAHGRQTLATTTNYPLSGMDGNQRRIYAVVTNRDATNAIIVSKANGTEVDTVFPNTSKIFHGDDALVLNSSASTVTANAIEYFVNESGPADPMKVRNTATPTGGGAGSSGGASSGSGYGGSYVGGGNAGGYQQP